MKKLSKSYSSNTVHPQHKHKKHSDNLKSFALMEQEDKLDNIWLCDWLYAHLYECEIVFQYRS